MSIWTGKGNYNAIQDFTERTERELVTRDHVFIRDTQPPDFEKKWVRDHLRMKDSVLELGCGLGVWAAVAHEVGCHYVGIDPVRMRVEYARAQHPRWAFICADARDFRSSMVFHCVLTVTVIQHLIVPDKIAALKTAAHHLPVGCQAFLLESGILDCTEAEAEALYASPKQADHMVPVPRALLEEHVPEFTWENDGAHDRWVLTRV